MSMRGWNRQEYYGTLSPSITIDKKGVAIKVKNNPGRTVTMAAKQQIV